MALVLYACVPGRGSEPGAGWEAVLSAAAWCAQQSKQLIVVTRALGGDDIRATVAESTAPGLSTTRFNYVDIPRWLENVLGGRASRLSFAAWQVKVLITFRSRRKEADIVHLATYATESVPPVALFAFRATSRVWGPLGSVELPRKGGQASVSLKLLWKRLILHAFGRKVSLLLVQSNGVASRAPRYLARRHRVRVQPNVVVARDDGRKSNGVVPRTFSTQLLSVGTLNSGKRTDLAISALLLLPPEVGLRIIGDGSERDRLCALVDRLGLSNRVEFVGSVGRHDVLKHMAASDLMVHPSFHEGAPWSVAEALSVGTPVVAFRGSGADAIIEATETVGQVVEEVTVEAFALGVQQALRDGRGPSTERWSRAAWQAAMADHYSSLAPVASDRACGAR